MVATRFYYDQLEVDVEIEGIVDYEHEGRPGSSDDCPGGFTVEDISIKSITSLYPDDDPVPTTGELLMDDLFIERAEEALIYAFRN